MDSDPLFLPAHEVQVWDFALDPPPAGPDGAEDWLSPAERARAAAFRFARDRDGFVAARCTLRSLLGRYLSRAPGELHFATSPYGKPRLEEDAGGDVRFNVSHSHGRGLVAFARGGEIGVDLEQMRAEVDCASLVATHFSAAEQVAWAALPGASRRAAFFHGWVRKEAYVKARGDGFSHPPDAYTVDLDPAGSGCLLADRTAPEAPAIWTVRSLPAPAGFAAALAYAGRDRTVQLFRL